ncbi:MSLN protein, partial [Nothocercus julius]|nr:MSLN protein [Nothocercus julius]
AALMINRYVSLGNRLTTPVLNAIGTKYVCLLNATELNAIDTSSLKTAALDPSACSQTTKDILYNKAKRAFSDQHNSRAYYLLIKPYLGGAPGIDLKALSKNQVNMDIETFTKLRKESLLDLTPTEVKDLLGVNLSQLKTVQNESPVREWIQKQKQSELDKLNVGLSGGTPDGYINFVTPKFQTPSSAPLGAVATVFHLLPTLLLSFLMMLVLS